MEKFKPGDRVRITGPVTYDANTAWMGFVAEVVEVAEGCERVRLRSVHPRPNNFDFGLFYWSVANLELVTPTSAPSRSLTERAREMAVELEAEADRIAKAQEDKVKGLRTVANLIRTAANAVEKLQREVQ